MSRLPFVVTTGFAALLIAGCGPADEDRTETPSLRLSPRVFGASGAPTPVGNGDEVKLWSAPQGGRWLLAGARIEGLAAGDVAEVRATLRDPATDAVIVPVQARVVRLAAHDGALEPTDGDVLGYAHLPVCPHDGAMPTPLVLALEVRDVGKVNGTRGEARVVVRPRCEEGCPCAAP